MLRFTIGDPLRQLRSARYTIREMRLRIRSFRRLVTLALPCWLLGGPLAATLQSVAVCPHHDAMPSSMHQGAGSTAPCWCPNMAGSATAQVPTLPAAPEHAASGFTVPTVTEIIRPQAVTLPSSPSFAPSPPPPNAIV